MSVLSYLGLWKQWQWLRNQFETQTGLTFSKLVSVGRFKWSSFNFQLFLSWTRMRQWKLIITQCFPMYETRSTWCLQDDSTWYTNEHVLVKNFFFLSLGIHLKSRIFIYSYFVFRTSKKVLIWTHCYVNNIVALRRLKLGSTIILHSSRFTLTSEIGNGSRECQSWKKPWCLSNSIYHFIYLFIQ